MNIQNLKVIKNSEINDKLLNDVLNFDRTIFKIDEEYSLPDGYLEKMYEKHKEGLFVLVDGDIVVGYANCIFLTDEIQEEYLRTKDYLLLENNGFQVGNNNMYFYTLALQEEYRDIGAIDILMQQFSAWVNIERQKGKRITSCISEAITNDGIKTLQAMGMLPQDVDENGLGIYYSPDCLNSYISKMIEKSIDDEER